jgi:hypothetical protein
MKHEPEDYNDELDEMSGEQFQSALAQAIETLAEENDAPHTSVGTFQEHGLLTQNHGLVVSIGQAEFQITIVKSR